jgi:hypothetical protein
MDIGGPRQPGRGPASPARPSGRRQGHSAFNKTACGFIIRAYSESRTRLRRLPCQYTVFQAVARSRDGPISLADADAQQSSPPEGVLQQANVA